MKALVVDDSRAIRVILTQMLKALGYRPAEARHGREALLYLQANPDTKSIPVVFVSSKNQKADQIWAKIQGAKALIGKPYSADQILDTLKAFG